MAASSGATRVGDKGAQTDQEVARAICTRLEYGGRRFEQGEFVAILDGAIVAVGKTFEAVDEVLTRLAPDRSRGLIVEVRPPEPDVVR